VTTRYKVIGSTAFQGHKPGELFDADLDPALEARAKERGQLRVVRHKPHEQEEEEATADAEADSAH
jgi:hypothetical protein